MITKFPHTISSEKFFTVIFSFLIPSYPVICHCVRIHISTFEVVFTDDITTTLFTPASVEVVLSEARTVALLVLACNAVVLTDARAVSLLALDSVKVVQTDTRVDTLLTPVSGTVVITSTRVYSKHLLLMWLSSK
jgi:hypothetical protein